MEDGKIGRNRNRRRDEIECDLNTMGIKKQIRDLGDGGRLNWNARYRAAREEREDGEVEGVLKYILNCVRMTCDASSLVGRNRRFGITC
jgi:hypothetical protein